jgi:hypothetical protein
MGAFTTAKTAIKFKAGSYRRTKGGPLISFNELVLETVLISLTKNKKIIRSEIAGKDGEVIEYMGAGSHDITINGMITSDYGVEPTEKINALNAILDAPISIQVICPFLNMKGIHQIVIMDSTQPQEAGGIAYQSFTINAISEVPVELRIKNV